MKWIALDSIEELDKITHSDHYTVIFKHSTRCPVSSMTKRQFEFEIDLIPTGTPIYLLDLIKHRSISNEIAERWKVKHESPQILLVKGNQCIYSESHNDIEATKVTIMISN